MNKKSTKPKQTNKLPKILIVVHFYRTPSICLKSLKFVAKHKIKIIEDAAHSLGSKQDKLIGYCEFSEITVFSLHPAKIITSAEGGLATSQDPNLLERMRRLSSHGIVRSIVPEEPWKYDMQELGYNYRMSDLHASLGLSQLQRIGDFLKIRKEIALYYIDKLKSLPLRMPLFCRFSMAFICMSYRDQ